MPLRVQQGGAGPQTARRVCIAVTRAPEPEKLIWSKMVCSNMVLTPPWERCLKSSRAWQTDRWTSPSLTWATWRAVKEDPGRGNIADAGNARRGGPEQEQELKIVHLLWMVSWEYMCNISIENHQQHYQYEQGHLFSISISWNVPQTIKIYFKSYVKREVQGPMS